MMALHCFPCHQIRVLEKHWTLRKTKRSSWYARHYYHHSNAVP